MRILIKYIVRNYWFGDNNSELVVGIWMGFMLGSTHLIMREYNERLAKKLFF